MEIWKDVVGYEGKYSVSNTGLIRRESRVITKIAFGKLVHTPRQSFVISQFENKGGYMRVHLSEFSYRQKKEMVHRIVAKAFIPNPNNYPFINHLDCNPANNNANNLEWCTRMQNAKHRKKNGGYKNRPNGVDAFNSILNEESVRHIRKFEMRNIDYCALYGVKPSTIVNVQKRNTWKHLS